MGPLDALRRTEQQVQEAARKGKELVSASMHNLEDQVRRGLHLKSRVSAGAGVARSRTGIVSVNGQDVETMRCTGGKK